MIAIEGLYWVFCTNHVWNLLKKMLLSAQSKWRISRNQSCWIRCGWHFRGGNASKPSNSTANVLCFGCWVELINVCLGWDSSSGLRKPTTLEFFLTPSSDAAVTTAVVKGGRRAHGLTLPTCGDGAFFRPTNMKSHCDGFYSHNVKDQKYSSRWNKIFFQSSCGRDTLNLRSASFEWTVHMFCPK